MIQEVDSVDYGDMACVSIISDYDDELSSVKIETSTRYCQEHVPSFTVSSASDKYTGATMTFSIEESEQSPGACDVSYACTDVSRLDGGDSGISCDDLAYSNSASGEFQLMAPNWYDYASKDFEPGKYAVTIT